MFKKMYVQIRCFLSSGKLILRHKHKDTHWSVVQKKTHAIDKAIDHFDDFYKQVFSRNWPSIRESLLGKQKYVAIVNNYGDIEETTKNLENAGALNMRTLFNLEKGYLIERYKKKRFQINLADVQQIEEPPQNEPVPEMKKEFSLEASMRDAEIDTSRLIDESTGSMAPILAQFLPTTKLKGREDWISESQHYKYYEKGSKMTVQIGREFDFHFPEKLNVYCFEHGNYSTFESPKKSSTDVYNYFLMDGASVLPILALDLQPGFKMLDMCAAPGGKSLLALQTLYPNYLECNDLSHSRVKRIFNIFEQYFYDLEKRWIEEKRLKVTNTDGRNIVKDLNFDRILVDVPCTTDRHSVIENENNIFKSGRIKERLKLPELQCALLVNALKLVRNGGVVVYSTCSLSPIQNDGVVHMALKHIWEETNIQIVVMDLSPALAQVQEVFMLAERNICRYGHLVIPFLPQNYGPMYFCKLKRIK